MAESAAKPVQSMTGQGAVSGPTPLGDVAVELRSVNGKSLGIKIRLAAECYGLESAFEKYLRKRLRRGSVSLVVAVQTPVTNAEALIDQEMANAAAERLRSLASDLGLKDGPGLSDILAMPGVVCSGHSSKTRVSWEPPAELMTLLTQATDRFIANRQAEGAATVELLQEQLEILAGGLQRVAARAPQVVGEYRSRLKSRVDEFLDGRGRAMEDADVLREVSLFAERADITEEMQRLQLHVEKASKTLLVGGQVGRSLEFLLQECLREVNTLGSKSPDAEIAHEVVAMKSAIDKLKEQVANLE